MKTLQTIIDEDKLQEWRRRLPECDTFLLNFFCSCRPYLWETNLLNYVHDIKVQIEIDPAWKAYEPGLSQAFLEITGSVGHVHDYSLN